MVREKISYALVIILLIIVGCTKISKQDTVVEFVMLNPADGKPFAGVPVQILEVKDTEFHGMVSEPIFEGVTDVNGRVKHTFKAKTTSKYWYIPVHDDSSFGNPEDYEYLTKPNPFNRPIKINQYNELKYEVVYYAYLKQNYKNTNCEGTTDTLIYHAWTPQFPGGGGAYDFIATRTGCVNIIDNSPARVYMGWHKKEWECRRPSGITHGVDSIWLDQGQLGTMELLY
jgi:hypothetical protein